MTMITTEFHACRPTLWSGRYARVEGESTVFHLRYTDGHLWPVLIWRTDECAAMCRAIASTAAIELTQSVARAKRHVGGEGGGSFLINEYGQVLVPSSDGKGKRLLAGSLHGKLLFENPLFPEEPIDLADRDHLENGDPWERPYVGIPYNLHRNGQIYFYHQDESGGRVTYPLHQDQELISAIRNVRPYGPVRILVTLGGLVLTKVPFETRQQSEDCWKSVFVGSINLQSWFEKE